MAHVRTDAPVNYRTDATFRALTRLYPAWADLPRWNRDNGELTEQRSLDQAAAIVMSSGWAKLSATSDYGVDPDKISVLPYGPNLRADLLPDAELPAPDDPARELQLLYTGVDWVRKGVECALALVVALPTIAYATPVVFSEAAAFSVPSVTFDVGGVGSAVSDSRSGIVLAQGTTPDHVAILIADLVADRARFEALRNRRSAGRARSPTGMHGRRASPRSPPPYAGVLRRRAPGRDGRAHPPALSRDHQRGPQADPRGCRREIGGSALCFGQLFPDARIVSIEPDPHNRAILRRNVGDRPNHVVMEAAARSEPGFVALQSSDLGWASRTERAEQGLPIVTIEDAFAASGGGDPLLVKIDIEGFEADLFSTNLGWIDRSFAISVEPHDWMLPGKGTSLSFQKALAPHGFELFIKGENLLYVRL